MICYAPRQFCRLIYCMCGELGVILPVSGSLTYCQEPRSEIPSYKVPFGYERRNGDV